mmetsp:Transcript_35568/g.48031  ORF Transcript_35568/g.48031 Transcript_35568/m.48031 type:complete len:145 (-) Transcript_35568:357-791(-)
MLHHVAILFCFSALAFFPSGFTMILVGIVIAEATNPIQLPWQWAQLNSKRTDIAESARSSHNRRYQSLSMAFTVGYAVMRGVVMPLSLIDIAIFLFYQGGMTPARVWIWFYCVLGCLGSFVWLYLLVAGYIRFRLKSASKARRD